jgi:hypothetical protein
VRLGPVPEAAAMARIFAAEASIGASDQEVEDLRIFVSDIATSLIEEGSEVLIEARLTDQGRVLTGNCPTRLPATGHQLFGDRLAFEDGQWQIRLPNI